MKLPQYAKLKRGTVYYQRRVPNDVQHAEPFLSMPSVFERSLNTSDLNEGLRGIAETNEWFERHLRAVRSGAKLIDDALPTPGAAAIKVRTRDHRWASFYAREEYDRLVGSTKLRRRAVNSGIEGARERLDDWYDNDVADLNSSIQDLRDRNPRVVRRLALSIFSAEGVIKRQPAQSVEDWFRRYPVEETNAFHILSEALIDARLDAYGALQNEFDGGLTTYAPQSATVRDAPRDLDEDDKHSLRTIAGQLIDGSADITKTWKTRLLLMPEVLDQFGFPTDVRRLTRAHVVDLMEKLARCPANKTQRFPNLTWPQALEANRVADLPRLNPNSLRDAFLAPLSRTLSYAENKGLMSGNPARNVKIAGAKRGARGTHFETHELNAMLQLPQFTGCRSTANVVDPGDTLLDNHYFWAPLLALFTGARTSEIAQLNLSEVVFAGKTPYFRIQSDDERSVKTDAGVRTVPIHASLLEIGLKEYVTRMKAAGQKRLFPDWEKPSEAAGFADAPSQRHFRRNVIPRISNQKSPSPTFHSFRNTMKGAMADCGVPQQHQNAMLGHEQTGMDPIYMTKKFDVSKLGESMAKVQFDGLEISHLVGTRTKVGDR